jgi:pilus assembly protein Flp/PilA
MSPETAFENWKVITMKLVQFIKNFAREEDGVTAIEYGLIASLVAVAIIAGATILGNKLDDLFTAIAGALVLP